MSHLVAARGALADPPNRALALDHLIKAWREGSRHPVLADLVEALSAESSRSYEELDSSLGDSDFHAAWMTRAVVASASELDRLTPGLFRGPLGKRIRERFDLLLRFADDPRMCRCFGRMVLEPPVMAASNFSLWTQLFAKLRAAPDIRLRVVLEQRLSEPGGSSQFWPMLQQRSLDLLAVLPVELPELDEDEAQLARDLSARIAELAAGAPAPVSSADGGLAAGLLADIYAHPTQVERRMVWADALLSRGDPRGEFVLLQLARAGSYTPPSKRERKLLAQHRLTWTGELGVVLERKSQVFEGGLLARGEVQFDSATERELIHSEAWATLRELDCDDPELFMQPQLRSLERAGGFDMPGLRRLLEHEGPRSPLREIGPVFVEQLPPFEIDHLRKAQANWLPEVESLWLHIDSHDLERPCSEFGWIFETPMGQRLRGLRVSGFPYMSYDSRKPDWAAWADAFVESKAWRGLDSLRLDMHRLSFEFVREPERLVLRVRHDYAGSVNAYRRKEANTVLGELHGRFDAIEFVGVNAKPARDEGIAVLARSAGFAQFRHEHRPGESKVGQDIWRCLHSLLARQQTSAKRLVRSRTPSGSAAPAKSKVRARSRRLAAGGNQSMSLVAAADEALDPPLGQGRWLGFCDRDRALLHLGKEGLSELEVPRGAARWHAQGSRDFVAAAYLPRRDWVWLGSRRGETLVWDRSSGRALARGRFHRTMITALCCVPEQGLLLSCDRDAKLLTWSDALESEDPSIAAMIPHSSHALSGHATALSLGPDGDTLALLTVSGEVSLRSAGELGRPRHVGHVGARGSVLGWAPSGDHLIAALPHGGLVIWDPEGVELTRLDLHSRKISAACWSVEGDLITASDEIFVTAADSGERRLRMQPKDGSITALSVSKDGRRLAVSSHSGLSMWSLQDGERLAPRPHTT